MAVDLHDRFHVTGWRCTSTLPPIWASLFPCFRAELDNLPFADSQFDIAVFNRLLPLSSEDYQQTLGEALRMRQAFGGAVVIADTAWYSSERRSGTRMIAERQAAFIERFGTASDAIRSSNS